MIDFLLSTLVGILALLFVCLYGYAMGPIQTGLLILLAFALHFNIGTK